MLREYGEVLRQQGAETFRAAAYQHAADVVERLTARWAKSLPPAAANP